MYLNLHWHDSWMCKCVGWAFLPHSLTASPFRAGNQTAHHIQCKLETLQLTVSHSNDFNWTQIVLIFKSSPRYFTKITSHTDTNSARSGELEKCIFSKGFKWKRFKWIELICPHNACIYLLSNSSWTCSCRPQCPWQRGRGGHPEASTLLLLLTLASVPDLQHDEGEHPEAPDGGLLAPVLAHLQPLGRRVQVRALHSRGKL